MANTAKDEAESYIWHDIPPRVLRVNSILTDLLGGSAVALVMDLEHDAYKQIEAIVSDSLLP